MQGFVSVEIYVRDVASHVRFFVDVFGFEVEYQQHDFANIWLGSTRLILNELNLDEFSHPNPTLKEGALQFIGAGSEIVISVNHLESAHKKVQASLAREVGDINRQEWGLSDFRFLLPDGHYIRVTEPDERVKQSW